MTRSDTHVAVLYGGWSAEREVSLDTGKGCIQALKCHRNTCPTGITTHDPRFQEGLVVEDKDKRVAHYAKGIVKDVETIAYSVGVSEPRLLRRRHVRIVQPDTPIAPYFDAILEAYERQVTN